MAFEENNFYVARKYELAKSDFTVECNVSAGVNVAKILSVSVDSCVESYELLNGVINYSGVIDTKIIVMSDDGQLNTVCSTCPFSSKFEGEELQTGQTAHIHLKIMDYNVESVSGDSIRLSVILQQSGFVSQNKEIKTIRCDDDNVCAKEDEISVIKFIGSASENIDVTSEINLRDKIKKLILTESKTVVKNVEAGVNFVTISGDVATRVLFLNENDKFENGYVYDSFKEEIELENVTRESFVQGHAYVKQDAVTTEIVEDEKGGKIVIKVPIKLIVEAFQEEKVSVIQDLYSVKNEINVTTESFEMTNICTMEMVEGKIEGNLSLDEDKPRVDKILFYGGNHVALTNSYIKDGEVFVEGIAKTTVVYLNDEDNSLYSAQIDVPFTLSEKTDWSGEGILTVDAIVCDVDVAVKKGRDLFYDAKVKACVNYCYNVNCGIISEATNGEEYPERDYAMEVVFAGAGEQLWEIAKKTRVKQEQITLQNPELTFPLVDDSSLILYYQKAN